MGILWQYFSFLLLQKWVIIKSILAKLYLNDLHQISILRITIGTPKQIIYQNNDLPFKYSDFNNFDKSTSNLINQPVLVPDNFTHFLKLAPFVQQLYQCYMIL